MAIFFVVVVALKSDMKFQLHNIYLHVYLMIFQNEKEDGPGGFSTQKMVSKKLCCTCVINVSS